MNIDTTRFNNLTIGTVFHYPSNADLVFVKFADADPTVPPHKQAPNSVGLHNRHYFCISAYAPVVIIKSPEDFDDFTLIIDN